VVVPFWLLQEPVVEPLWPLVAEPVVPVVVPV
jgi:hypothetical protein